MHQTCFTKIFPTKKRSYYIWFCTHKRDPFKIKTKNSKCHFLDHNAYQFNDQNENKYIHNMVVKVQSIFTVYNKLYNIIKPEYKNFQTDSCPICCSKTHSSDKSRVWTYSHQASWLSELSSQPNQFSSSAEVAFLEKKIHTQSTEWETPPPVTPIQPKLHFFLFPNHPKISLPHIIQCKSSLSVTNHWNPQFPTGIPVSLFPNNPEFTHPQTIQCKPKSHLQFIQNHTQSKP